MEDKKLGNEIKNDIVDKLLELSRSCKKSHSEISGILEDIALDLGMLSNRLVNEDGNIVGECRLASYIDDDSEEEIIGGSYRFLDATRIKLKGK